MGSEEFQNPACPGAIRPAVWAMNCRLRNKRQEIIQKRVVIDNVIELKRRGNPPKADVNAFRFPLTMSKCINGRLKPFRYINWYTLNLNKVS